MEGKVVKIGEDPNKGEILGANAGSLTFLIPLREADVRRLKLGDPVTFITTKEGNIEIIVPKPQLGCERER